MNDVQTTESVIPMYQATCTACGWVSPERWRRWDEAATDLHAHIRGDHLASIKELRVKRVVTEEVIEEAE